MYYENIINTIKNFTEKLYDEQSKALYDARLKYFFDRDVNELETNLIEAVKENENRYSCWGLNTYFSQHPKKQGEDISFVVFGAGYMGRSTIRTLKLMGYKISAVVDNDVNKHGTEVEGYIVSSPELIVEKYRNDVVIVSMLRIYQIEVYYQLLNMGVSNESICMHQEGGLFCDFGNQYFDFEGVVPNEDGEIFIDAGCFDGNSSYNASIWSKGKLKKVIAFEPDKNSIKKCEDRIKQIGCEYEFYNLATWNDKANLCFKVNQNAGYGSRISENGNDIVLADSIDNILKGAPATYIKLDVEGSELQTLKGAINTIKKYRPKMAISIYHKPEDIIEIPAFLEELGMDYKYAIRQYQTRQCETTLYVY